MNVAPVIGVSRPIVVVIVLLAAIILFAVLRKAVSQLPRRITRRADLIIGIPVLLLLLHFVSFLLAAYAHGAKRMPSHLDRVVGIACIPAFLYIQAELPGSDFLDDASTWAYRKGAESIRDSQSTHSSPPASVVRRQSTE